MLLWLAHRAWNIFCDPQGDCLGLPLPWFWPAEDKVILGSTFWQSGFPSFVPGHFFILGVGLGLEMEWAEVSRTFWPHNSPSRSCCPDPQTGRWILTFSGLNHGRLSLVSLWVLGFLRLPMARSWHFGVRGASSSMLSFWRECGSLQYTECVFNGAFMKWHGFGSWRFPWELGESYFAWHSFFELCVCGELPQVSSSM